VEKSQQRPTPLAGRAEVLCDSAHAPDQSVLNTVSRSVLAPARRPTLHCHGPQRYLCQGMSFSGWPRPRGVAVRCSNLPCAVLAERDTQVHATPSPARRNPQKSRARPWNVIFVKRKPQIFPVKRRFFNFSSQQPSRGQPPSSLGRFSRLALQGQTFPRFLALQGQTFPRALQGQTFPRFHPGTGTAVLGGNGNATLQKQPFPHSLHPNIKF